MVNLGHLERPKMKYSCKLAETEKEEIRNYLISVGFKEICGFNAQPQRRKAIYRRDHIKLEFQYSHATMKVQTDKKGWKRESSFSPAAGLKAVKRAVEYSEKIPAPEFKKRKNAQDIPCFHFSEKKFDLAATRISRISQIGSVRVVKVVAIDDDCRLIDANSPDLPAWFLLDCTGRLGATFNLVTNGDDYYPVTRYNKIQRITDHTSPKASVDLSNLGYYDKEIVEEAIRRYAAQ